MKRSPQLLLFPRELTQDHIKTLADRARQAFSCPMMTVSNIYKTYSISTWTGLADWLEEHSSQILPIACEVAAQGSDAYKAVLRTFEGTDFDIESYLNSMGIHHHE